MHPHISRSATLLAFLAACSSADGGESTNFTVRDSAGVTIVESAAPAWTGDEGWRVAAEPTLEIGMADGPPEYLLGQVMSAVRRDDGSIVLVNAASSEIRFYDAQGRHLRTVGGQGGGPGEYQQPHWVQVIRGDTILAYDFPAKRLSILAPDGSFLRAHTLEGFSSPPWVYPALVDGSLVAMVRRVVGDAASTSSGLRQSQEVILHLDRKGTVLDTISVEAPTTEYVQVTEGGGSIGSASYPMVFGPSILVAPTGERVAVARSDEWRLRLYRPGTGLDGVVRRPIDPRPVTDEVMRAEEQSRQEQLARVRNPAARQRRAESMAGQPVAEVLPFFSRMLADADGRLWLQNYRAPGEETTAWTVHDVDGRLLGEVRLPERFTPRQLGPDFVLGVSRDEMDVERVRLYRLEKGVAQ